MRKTSCFFLFFLSFAAVSVFAAGEARLVGLVTDPDGQPLSDVTILVTSTEGKNFKSTFKTDKRGRYAIFLLDGSVTYTFHYSKDGYQSFETKNKLMLNPQKNEGNVKLAKAGVVQAAAVAVESKPDPAVVAYNTGVALLGEKKDAEAIAKFEEAVALNPDLTAGHLALANMYVRTSEWKKAIDAGTKVLESDPENGDAFALMAEAYEKLGDKAKAAEYEKKAPVNPGKLFNEAARQINQGNDAGAESLLKQSIAADEAFGIAHYELGMLYARASKNSEARKHLEKYLELEPDGKDAGTAKEMLNYLK